MALDQNWEGTFSEVAEKSGQRAKQRGSGAERRIFCEG
jgi:hypothetical protein